MQGKLCSNSCVIFYYATLSWVDASVTLHKILLDIVIISFRKEILGICHVHFFVVANRCWEKVFNISECLSVL